MPANRFTIPFISFSVRAVPIITALRHARDANIVSSLGNLTHCDTLMLCFRGQFTHCGLGPVLSIQYLSILYLSIPVHTCPFPWFPCAGSLFINSSHYSKCHPRTSSRSSCWATPMWARAHSSNGTYCTQFDMDLNAHVLDNACLSLLMGQVRLREIHG
jgi:hypothetical protein